MQELPRAADDPKVSAQTATNDPTKIPARGPSPYDHIRAATANLYKPSGGVRRCRSCSACCTVMLVHELSKPPGQPCPKLKPKNKRKAGSQGCCSVYEARPRSCGVYTCYWLKGLFENRDRPDRVGLIVDTADPMVLAIEQVAKVPICAVREVWPGAHRGKRFKVLLASLAARCAVIYYGKGNPPIMAPGSETMGKVQAALAKVDHWSLLVDHHRQGKHADDPQDECGLCIGRCPAHAADGGFHPSCSVCIETLSAIVQRKAALAEAHAADGEGDDAT